MVLQREQGYSIPRIKFGRRTLPMGEVRSINMNHAKTVTRTHFSRKDFTISFVADILTLIWSRSSQKA